MTVEQEWAEGGIQAPVACDRHIASIEARNRRGNKSAAKGRVLFCPVELNFILDVHGEVSE